MEDRITMKAARINAGLTQKEIARRMQVSYVTISHWENGYVIPKPAQFEMYARMCGRPADRIILPTKLT